VDLLEMTKDMLELHGCAVLTASEGPTGLTLMLDEPCDIAFIDIGLPGLDGLQLASRIRARGSDGPYLVAITGYGQDGDRSCALAAGFDEHIVKPVTIEVIQRALAASQHRQPRSMPNSR
jgi:CheY-like chemotaxis protein